MLSLPITDKKGYAAYQIGLKEFVMEIAYNICRIVFILVLLIDIDIEISTNRKRERQRGGETEISTNRLKERDRQKNKEKKIITQV